MKPHLDDLEYLALFMPWPNYVGIAIADIPNLTLVYDADADRILGCFTLDVFKRTFELHGVCRQDLAMHYPPDVASDIMRQWSRIFLQDVFTRFQKDNLILKVPKQSAGGRGFAILNGFKRINKEKGAIVYRLTKQEYQARLSHHG